jgi:hypothetical protein
MKWTRSIAIACACALLLSMMSLRVVAGDEKPAPAKDSAAKDSAGAGFEALRALEGTWESDKPGEDGKPMTLVFRVTSAGSVVAETMFPGSSHEMLNTYHLDGDRLMVTHYCAQGVQPRMKMTQSANGTMKFEFVDGTNLQAHEPQGHMGALEITISGDKLIEKWGFLKPGEKEPVSFKTFELHRKNG